MHSHGVLLVLYFFFLLKIVLPFASAKSEFWVGMLGLEVRSFTYFLFWFRWFYYWGPDRKSVV